MACVSDSFVSSCINIYSSYDSEVGVGGGVCVCVLGGEVILFPGYLIYYGWVGLSPWAPWSSTAEPAVK